MISRVDEVLDDLEDWKRENLQASGVILKDAYQQEIVRQGLIDTGHFVNSVDYEVDGDEVRAGTPIRNPPYPVFLEFGFRHWISGEIVGPFRPLTRAASNAEDPLRALWGTPIRGT